MQTREKVAGAGWCFPSEGETGVGLLDGESPERAAPLLGDGELAHVGLDAGPVRQVEEKAVLDSIDSLQIGADPFDQRQASRNVIRCE